MLCSVREKMCGSEFLLQFTANCHADSKMVTTDSLSELLSVACRVGSHSDPVDNLP